MQAHSTSIREKIVGLPTSRIAQVAALGFGNPEIIPLWYGEGDLPTPGFIGAAATAALEAGETFYTYKAGLPELRETIATYLGGLYGREIRAERVAVTSSGMTALMIVSQMLIDPGDNLVIVAPIWPNIAAAVTIMGGEPRLVSLDAVPDGGWRLDPEKLFAACDSRTRGVFVNSPSNPTGWVITPEEIAALVGFARSRRLWLIADEVYGRIVYGNRAAPSFLEHTEAQDRVIVVNSFSKTWAMTGWRLGLLTLPPSLMPEIEKLVEFNTSGSPTFMQRAAITAIRDGEPFVEGFAARCRAARDVAIDGSWRAGGCRWRGPRGRSTPSSASMAWTTASPSRRNCCTRPKSGWRRGVLSARWARAGCACASPVTRPRWGRAVGRLRAVLD